VSFKKYNKRKGLTIQPLAGTLVSLSLLVMACGTNEATTGNLSSNITVQTELTQLDGPGHVSILADVDGDQQPEIVAAWRENTSSSRSVGLFKITPDGTLNRVWKQSFPSLAFTNQDSGPIAIGDVTGDGTPDIVTSTWSDEHVYVINASDGALIKSIYIGAPEHSHDPTLVNLDDDAALEIVVGTVAGSYAELRAYNADGSLLWTRQSFELVDSAISDAVEAAVLDLDKDGKPELVHNFLQTGNHYRLSRAFTKADGTPFQDNIELGNIYGVDTVLGAMDGGTSPNVITGHSNAIQVQGLDGSMVSGSPLSTLPEGIPWYQYQQSPLFLSDIDNDGDLEMGFQAMDYANQNPDALIINSEIRVWNHDGTVHPASVKFPTQTVTNADERNALYGQIVTPVTVDIDGDGQLEIVSFTLDCMLRISDAKGVIVKTYAYDASDATGLACRTGSISSFTTNTDVYISFSGSAFSRDGAPGGGFISHIRIPLEVTEATVKNPNNWSNPRRDLARTGGLELTRVEPVPSCGDGSVDQGELCDDGNQESGDGCLNTCIVDEGYTCTGSPSVCSVDPNKHWLPWING